MAQDFRPFEVRDWDIFYAPRIALDVRALATLSILVEQEAGSATAWAQTINVKWSYSPDGTASDFGTPVTITTAAPSETDIDVSGVNYIILERASAPSASTMLKVTGGGKADPGAGIQI